MEAVYTPLGSSWSELTFTLEVTVYLEFTTLPAASRYESTNLETKH